MLCVIKFIAILQSVIKLRFVGLNVILLSAIRLNADMLRVMVPKRNFQAYLIFGRFSQNPSNKSEVLRLLADRRLADKHLADKHLTDKYLADRHLIDVYL